MKGTSNVGDVILVFLVPHLLLTIGVFFLLLMDIVFVLDGGGAYDGALAQTAQHVKGIARRRYNRGCQRE